MARKKKTAEEYIIAGIRDNLVLIAVKTKLPIEQLRALNPDIKNVMFKIPQGQKVRIL